MALPTTGKISLLDIWNELNPSGGTPNCSLKYLCEQAGKPIGSKISDFYGFQIPRTISQELDLILS